MTTTGFTSAVEHRDDPSLLMVRARDEVSLTNLANDLGYEPHEVFTSFPSDYPFRMSVSKIEYAQWTYDQVISIDYDNFKWRAAQKRGGRYVDFLHKVWRAGHALTDADVQRKNDAAWDERP